MSFLLLKFAIKFQWIDLKLSDNFEASYRVFLRCVAKLKVKVWHENIMSEKIEMSRIHLVPVGKIKIMERDASNFFK